MSRLEKKCFIVSGGMHLLLVTILLIGPAFLSSKSSVDNLPVLDFVPMKTIDAAFAGGGNPDAKPPPPAPLPAPPQPQVAPPLPQPQPKIVAKPEPVKVSEPAKLTPDSFGLAADKKLRKPDVSTTLVARSGSATKKTSASASGSEAQARADAKRRSDQIGSAVRSIREGLSSSTTVEIGPGGGGPTYANFLQAVRSVYARAWAGRVPAGATDIDTDAVASITINRDGTVASASITRSSGNAVVDQAVQGVLDRVRYVVPLPEDSKDQKREVTITFKANAGQLAG